MKAKVLINFVDRVESEIQKKEVLRTVDDVFTVSQSRFNEIKRQGDFVEEVELEAESEPEEDIDSEEVEHEPEPKAKSKAKPEPKK